MRKHEIKQYYLPKNLGRMQMKLRARSFAQHLWELVLVNEEPRAHTCVEWHRLKRQQPQARELRTHTRHVRLTRRAEIYGANSASIAVRVRNANKFRDMQMNATPGIINSPVSLRQYARSACCTSSRVGPLAKRFPRPRRVSPLLPPPDAMIERTLIKKSRCSSGSFLHIRYSYNLRFSTSCMLCVRCERRGRNDKPK